MNVQAARAAWDSLPAWSRWPIAYAALLFACVLIGLVGVGIGNAMFVAGAIVILSSLYFLRTGGPRKVIVTRDEKGRPLKDLLPAEKRELEIKRGLAVFLLGLALWAPLLWIAFRR